MVRDPVSNIEFEHIYIIIISAVQYVCSMTMATLVQSQNAKDHTVHSKSIHENRTWKDTLMLTETAT